MFEGIMTLAILMTAVVMIGVSLLILVPLGFVLIFVTIPFWFMELVEKWRERKNKE